MQLFASSVQSATVFRVWNTGEKVFLGFVLHKIQFNSNLHEANSLSFYPRQCNRKLSECQPHWAIITVCSHRHKTCRAFSKGCACKLYFTMNTFLNFSHPLLSNWPFHRELFLHQICHFKKHLCQKTFPRLNRKGLCFFIATLLSSNNWRNLRSEKGFYP